MKIEDLKEKAYKVISSRLDISTSLSCDDILSLSKAIAELEKNEVFKVVANAGSVCAFGGEDNG